MKYRVIRIPENFPDELKGMARAANLDESLAELIAIKLWEAGKDEYEPVNEVVKSDTESDTFRKSNTKSDTF